MASNSVSIVFSVRNIVNIIYENITFRNGYHAGRAVINAAENGASFPLKRRDQLLDYILTLMGVDENDDFADSSLELLRTQVF